MFAAALCLALTLLNTSVSLFFDEVIGYSLAWSEEVNTLFFCWTTFLGAALIARYAGHIGVDTLVNYLPPKLKKGVLWFNTFLALIVVWVMFYYGTKLAFFVGKSQKSIYLDLNLTYYYLAIPVSGVILGLNTLGFALGGSRESEYHTVS